MQGRRILTALAALSLAPCVFAEDGYDLWLRYVPVQAEALAPYRSGTTQLVLSTGTSGPPTPTLTAARDELNRALTGLLGATPPASAAVTQDGALLLGTGGSPAIAALRLDLSRLGPEGYVIRSLPVTGHRATVIAANTEIGVLYGVFHFLRLMQTRQAIDNLDLSSVPKVQHRVLNHWDNLDRTVERGYAGASIWDWHKLPDYLDPRYTDYARACASVGINGTVLTNVNANAVVLTPAYIRKTAALAGVLRRYGLRVYLSARFSAPIEIGGLKTADPFDPGVQAWWRAKVDEIYREIPDFGGFLVKANSEGQPGPQDYGRSHADGANMLADAVAPHGGIVMWRAFVYSNLQPDDRAKQAWSEFVPLDGKFRANVLLQVKNGAIDFQPREPFHPLFGAMPKTPLMLELQITKEYLGFATHLVYLAPLYEETLKSDTFVKGKGSTVATVIDGSLQGYAQTGMAGVSNIGADRNWTGSQFDQANWYAFGRLAWNPEMPSATIAEEWVRMTFSNDAAFVQPVVKMMMGSREAAVDYMTPLGLHHLMASGHHYGPGPWVSGGPRADWTPVYFHRADAAGIGFDRTATGSNAIAQYAPKVAAEFGDRARVPEKFLLWFHHVPWDSKLASGRTLWDELVLHYTRGVDTVRDMRKTWSHLAPYVDTQRFAQVSSFLGIQENEAKWWRDACIAYFQTFSKRPLPAGVAPPEHTLQEYEAINIPYAPGHPPANPGKQPEKPAAITSAPSPPVELTAAQDHQRLLKELGIASLRPGANPRDPNAPNAPNYDEAKANPYPELPDALELTNGRAVKTADAWWKQRRPEIVEAFDREVYGRVPPDVPRVTWEVVSRAEETIGGVPAIRKHVVGHVDNSAYPAVTVDIDLTVTTPAKVAARVPLMMEFFFPPRPGAPAPPASAGPDWRAQLLQHGWGFALLVPTSIQADNGAGLTRGIIGLANKGQPRKPDEWGALRAWAWGASRALDYLETDPVVDAKRVGIEGLSRYGKAALVAMAYEPRFAIGFVASSGAGGAKLHRRDFGERVENVASAAEYHWMAGNYLKYAGPLTAQDLPVDAHELIALCAPRPVFISAGSPEVEGGWIDARGMFMAAVAAGPVYKLLGRRDLGTSQFPPMETALVTGDIAFRQHSGGHTAGPNWPAFIQFASRYWQ
jgi:alpha-glucuronidase